jgi:predicted O-methyltransferase YrrM
MTKAPDKFAVLEELVARQPAFHHDGGKEQVWSARRETLSCLAEITQAGHRTIETGTGASTVIFAAAGAKHTAISPMSREHKMVRRYCIDRGVSTDRLELIEGYSEEILPSYYPETAFDVAFIDGKHSFPYPILDWHYITNSLKVGGTLVLDDVRALTVEMLCRTMLADAGWQLKAALDGEAAVFTKTADPAPGDPWQNQKLASVSEFERHFRAVSQSRRSGVGAAFRRLRSR